MAYNQLIRKFPPQVVHIRNAVPLDLIAGVRTPNEKGKRYKEGDFLPELDDFLLDYAKKYGTPVGYDRERDGAMVQNIFPDRKEARSQISSSSAVVLQMHTEAAFHPYKPDWILLACVRGDKRAATTFATLDDILYELDEGSLWELRQPDFMTTVDKSFRTKGEPDKEYIVRPLVGSGDWVLTYDADLMRPLTDHAAKAFGKLGGAIKKRTRKVVLDAGDILVINNRTTVHGRNSFKARYDGTDRWIKRVLVRETMPPPRKTKDGVILTDA